MSDHPIVHHRSLRVEHTGRNQKSRTLLSEIEELMTDDLGLFGVRKVWLVGYLGHSLGTEWSMGKDGSEPYLVGRYGAEELERRIQDFIDRYVLCPRCRMPALNIHSQSHGKHRPWTFWWCTKCRATGPLGELDPDGDPEFLERIESDPCPRGWQ